MNPPRRWLSADGDAPPGVRELLEQGGEPPPFEASLEAAVGERIQASTMSRGGGIVVKIGLALGMIAGTAGLAAALFVAPAALGFGASPETVPSEPAPEATSEATEAPPRPPAEAPAIQAPASEVRSEAASSDAPRGHARSTQEGREHARPERSPATPATAADQLAQEARLLEAARAALADDPETCLALTRRHQRRFPRGQLALERDVLRTMALRSLGRSDEASQTEAAVRTGAVGSPYLRADK